MSVGVIIIIAVAATGVLMMRFRNPDAGRLLITSGMSQRQRYCGCGGSAFRRIAIREAGYHSQRTALSKYRQIL